MASSAKGLNPFAPEFRSSRTRLAYPPPFNPYASSFYSSTCFPTYSMPFPTEFPYPNQDLKHHVVEPASDHQTKLAEVEEQGSGQQQQTHEAVKNFVPPKFPRKQKGFRSRHGRFFNYQPIRRSTSSTDQKPAAAFKSEMKVFENWRVPRMIKRRVSDVLPVIKDGDCTTVMIRNIPNKYSRDLLTTFLDHHCAIENQKSEGGGESESAFDFLYLPIDFWTGMNKGYAFVNFTNPKAVWKFYLAAHCQTWDSFHSNKVREIAYARIQGKKDLIQHFETMGFPCESENVLPISFSPARDGSETEVETRVVGKLEGWDVRGLRRQAATWKK